MGVFQQYHQKSHPYFLVLKFNNIYLNFIYFNINFNLFLLLSGSVICFINVFFFIKNMSEFNTQNVIDMSYMFYGYSSLIFLSDISDWNTEKVINMSSMFNDCASSKFLSDISK